MKDLFELDEKNDCHYVVDQRLLARFCGAPVQEGSSYCPAHHRLCHTGRFTKAWEDIASMVDGVDKSVTVKQQRPDVATAVDEQIKRAA